MMTLDSAYRVEQVYRLARQVFAETGVDTDQALSDLERCSLSLHCWQGDDVGGFESTGQSLGGGLAVTGNYPGRARTPDELRADVEQALRLLPGRHRLNLHAMYADFAGRGAVDRDQLEIDHFQSWIDWARANQLGLDFNPTFFSHPLAADGFTLSHRDQHIRQFWIDHAKCCRRIGAAFGAALGTPCVTNVWIPDGSKDLPVDRKSPRERLAAALDEAFAKPLDPANQLDAVESKLFGLGSECYVVGSHEFYLGYATTRQKVLCLDAGHFHPTEVISDKFSAVMDFVPRMLLHISRGVRWDSDHVALLTDDVRSIAEELVRGGYLDRVHLGLDYFDASINRVAAWVLGARSVLQALLIAMLQPLELLRRSEEAGDYTTRLVVMEQAKALPWSAVWDMYCLRHDVPLHATWLDEVRRYERTVLAGRTTM